MVGLNETSELKVFTIAFMVAVVNGSIEWRGFNEGHLVFVSMTLRHKQNVKKKYHLHLDISPLTKCIKKCTGCFQEFED